MVSHIPQNFPPWIVWGHHQAAETLINQLSVRLVFRVGKQNTLPGCKSFHKESNYKAGQEKALTVNTRDCSPQPSLLSYFLSISLKTRRVWGGTIFNASLKRGDFYKPLCCLRCRQEPASSWYWHPARKLFRYSHSAPHKGPGLLKYCHWSSNNPSEPSYYIKITGNLMHL